MFGLRFGHPNLKRILCHPAFVGHPLRKDYEPGQRWLLREGEQDEPVWARQPHEDDDHFETQVINLGPSHPATHGTLRTVVRLDGEIITQAEVEIGYLHRCFEKMAERHTWKQVIRMPPPQLLLADDQRGRLLPGSRNWPESRPHPERSSSG